MKINASKITLSRGSTGVTGASGTANSLSKVYSYQVPPGMNLILDEETLLNLKDHGATETADASLVEIRAVPANGLGYKILSQTTYARVKFDPLRVLQFYPVSDAKKLTPFVNLEIWVNSNQTMYGAVAGSVDFYLEAKYQNA